jgi:putative ABC transport system permease protein
MSLLSLAARNLLRHRLRSLLTVSGVAVAIMGFVLLRTVIWAWTAQSEDTATDRIVTRHKVTFVMHLPRRYVDEIRDMKEVRTATWCNWFGGKDENHQNEFFATMACDEKTLLQVYDDMKTPPDQAKAFIEDRQGALVGEKLMQRFGWKVGQTITLTSQIYSGNWELHIAGVYKALRKSVDPAQIFFHWDLLNERIPERAQNKVGWIVARVAPGKSAVDVSAAIDKAFDANDVQTLSQDEHSFQQSFMAMFSAILAALNVVSLVILGIMMLILGNTVAMGVRERTAEYAVLRAIGFLPRHLFLLVVGEAATLGLAGGAVGIGIAYPFINYGMGRFIEENLGQFFPFFRVTPELACMGAGLAISVGVIASLPPAITAYRLQVIEALRRVV